MHYSHLLHSDFQRTPKPVKVIKIRIDLTLSVFNGTNMIIEAHIILNRLPEEHCIVCRIVICKK